MKRYDVLVVHKLDRFARNVKVTLDSLEKLEKGGRYFVSITEQMDFTTPIGKVILANLAAFGQYYSDNLSTEVRKGMKERAEQGLWNGPVPFGYEKSADGTLAVVPKEAAIVRRLFEMYAAGTTTLQELTTWMNNTEFHPRVRNHDRKGPGFMWSVGTVEYMLRNAFYTGCVKYKGRLLSGKHAPIITRELFDQVQQVRKAHFKGPYTFAKAYRPYLLKGLVRCIHCGATLWAHYIKGHERYQETSAERGIPCPIGRGYVRAVQIDQQVSDIISNLRLPESWRQLGIELLSSQDEAAAQRRSG
jgi:hypothetical protein